VIKTALIEYHSDSCTARTPIFAIEYGAQRIILQVCIPTDCAETDAIHNVPDSRHETLLAMRAHMCGAWMKWRNKLSLHLECRQIAVVILSWEGGIYSGDELPNIADRRFLYPETL
jgi:hypothetical protein